MENQNITTNKSLINRIKDYKKSSTIFLDNNIIIEIKFKDLDQILNNLNIKDQLNLYKDLVLDLSKRFQCSYVYFNKNKIIVLCKKKHISYNSNINKLISNISSYTTLSFNKHLFELYKKYKLELDSSHFKLISQEKINYIKNLELLQFIVSNEVEVYSIPSYNEIFNVFYFYLNENVFNSKISFLKEHNFYNKNINIKNIDIFINNFKEETNYLWEDLHDFDKFGAHFKHKDGFRILKKINEFNHNYINYILE